MASEIAKQRGTPEKRAFFDSTPALGVSVETDLRFHHTWYLKRKYHPSRVEVL